MAFIEHFYGIKITGDFVAIEPADQFGDLSKYTFAITDRQTSSYNGNVTYAATISPLGLEKEINIEGWTLKYIRFDGNWFGNWGICGVLDSFGEELEIAGCECTKWYSDQSQNMLRTCLQNFIKFAHDNYSVEYRELIEKKLCDHFYGKIDDVYSQLKEVTDYISEYRKMIAKLQEKESNSKYIGKLQLAVAGELNTLLGVDI